MTEKRYVRGANPYMPLWEHVPDGEPRVFTHDGEERVYVYGSHDMLKNEYCGTDYVVWSAPVKDLTNWTCHGVCYEAEDHSVLFAPDVVKRGHLLPLCRGTAGFRDPCCQCENTMGTVYPSGED